LRYPFSPIYAPRAVFVYRVYVDLFEVVAARDWIMPPKIRDLIAELEKAGFVNRSGKGSHRNFVHPNVSYPVIISGNPGDDAKHYQVRAVRLALKELTK
jgi:predicted RNA binding protein YcfA (HicA-like mRNA interferase family)